VGKLVKVNVKLPLCLTKHHAMKAYWGSRGTAPRIRDLGIRWMWVVSFKYWPLYRQRRSPCYPLERRLGGPQSQSVGGGEEKTLQPLLGLEPASIQPSAIPLSYPGSNKMVINLVRTPFVVLSVVHWNILPN